MIRNDTASWGGTLTTQYIDPQSKVDESESANIILLCQWLSERIRAFQSRDIR